MNEEKKLERVVRRSSRKKDSIVKNEIVEPPTPDFIWVQCDSCQKWRKIDKQMEDKLGDMWYCRMNSDPLCQSCDLPEEEWMSPTSGWIYTYQGFLVGQLVWAKMRSYPPWPGIISPDPWCSNTYVSREVDGLLYHVEFLGKTRSHLWLPEEKVQTYQMFCSLEGRKSNPSKEFKYNRKLQNAISEAERLVSMSNEERIALCHYTEEEKDRLEKIQKRKVKRNHEKPTLTHHTIKTKAQSKPLPPPTYSQVGTSNKLQQIPELSITTDSLTKAALLQLLYVPNLLNGLVLNSNTNTPSSGLIPAAKTLQPTNSELIPAAKTLQPTNSGLVPAAQTLQPMSVAQKLTPTKISPKHPVKKRGRPCKSGIVTKKKKYSPPVSSSQSILRYFESQENPKNVPINNDTSTVIDLTDQVVPENTIDTHLESFHDLEKDVENDMLNIEDMLSQFDTTTDKISKLDYSDIAENEMSQIEELLASFQNQ